MVLRMSASWEKWRTAKRENKRAKARSDEIDRQIEEEAKTFGLGVIGEDGFNAGIINGTQRSEEHTSELQ